MQKTKRSVAHELAWLNSLERFGIRPGLTRMRQLMAALDHPEQRFQAIHITGTNGKGSTAVMVASVLRAAGLRVGLYTSPHLNSFRERITINGHNIQERQLLRLLADVRQACVRRNIEATYFEFTTALAFLHFARTGVALAVVEVGLGGTQDATNVVTPLVSVITNISLDHTEHLGSTCRHIAREKAGIIKAKRPVVIGERDSVVLSQLRRIAKRLKSPVYLPTQQLTISAHQRDWHDQQLKVRGIFAGQYRLPLLGAHQVENAAVALATLDVVRAHGFAIPRAAVRRGLQSLSWPGRLQLVRRRPFTVVDGAHNPAGMAALFNALTDPLHPMPAFTTLVVAMKASKEAGTLLAEIVPLFERVIVTEGTYQPEPAERLARQLRPLHSDITIIPEARAATRAALTATPAHGGILITGSLYMIGEALTVLKRTRRA